MAFSIVTLSVILLLQTQTNSLVPAFVICITDTCASQQPVWCLCRSQLFLLTSKKEFNFCWHLWYLKTGCPTFTFIEVSPNPKIAIFSRVRKPNVKNIEVLGIIQKLNVSYWEFNVYIPQQVKMLSILRSWMKSLAEDPGAEHSSTAILSTYGQQSGKTQILIWFFSWCFTVQCGFFHSHLFFCCIKMIKFKY